MPKEAGAKISSVIVAWTGNIRVKLTNSINEKKWI